tara:strand:+ start:18116 stop:18295 length:180 start_codon:yes stop_codon:yes gene_type:complete
LAAKRSLNISVVKVKTILFIDNSTLDNPIGLEDEAENIIVTTGVAPNEILLVKLTRKFT